MGILGDCLCASDVTAQWGGSLLRQQRLLAGFDRADADDSGGLDVDEFCDMLMLRRDTIVERVFDIIDDNRDGVISLLEILKFLGNIHPNGVDGLHFSFFIHSGAVGTPGRIKKRELVSIVQRHHEFICTCDSRDACGKQAVRKVNRYLASTDENNDGEVDWGEFQILWKKFPTLFYPILSLHQILADLSDAAEKLLKKRQPSWDRGHELPPPWRQMDLTRKQRLKKGLSRNRAQYLSDVIAKQLATEYLEPLDADRSQGDSLQEMPSFMSRVATCPSSPDSMASFKEKLAGSFKGYGTSGSEVSMRSFKEKLGYIGASVKRRSSRKNKHKYEANKGGGAGTGGGAGGGGGGGGGGKHRGAAGQGSFLQDSFHKAKRKVKGVLSRKGSSRGGKGRPAGWDQSPGGNWGAGQSTWGGTAHPPVRKNSSTISTQSAPGDEHGNRGGRRGSHRKGSGNAQPEERKPSNMVDRRGSAKAGGRKPPQTY